jgi:hypothetical protein
MLSLFKKHIFGILKKSEIKYTYTYDSKGTIEILEKNILYFELYKKDKFLTKLYLYTATNLLILFISKYNALSTKTSHDYLGHVYLEYFFKFLKHKNTFLNILKTRSTGREHQICSHSRTVIF